MISCIHNDRYEPPTQAAAKVRKRIERACPPFALTIALAKKTNVTECRSHRRALPQPFPNAHDKDERGGTEKYLSDSVVARSGRS
jgi:hypothetical protein